MSHRANRAAAARYASLRQAGVPRLITPHEAWHLSGGIVGQADRLSPQVPLALVAKECPDAAEFLDDWREAQRTAVTRLAVLLLTRDAWDAALLAGDLAKADRLAAEVAALESPTPNPNEKENDR